MRIWNLDDTVLLEEGLSPTVRCSTGLVRVVISLHNRLSAAPARTLELSIMTHSKESLPSDFPLEPDARQQLSHNLLIRQTKKLSISL